MPGLEVSFVATRPSTTPQPATPPAATDAQLAGSITYNPDGTIDYYERMILDPLPAATLVAAREEPAGAAARSPAGRLGPSEGIVDDGLVLDAPDASKQGVMNMTATKISPQVSERSATRGGHSPLRFVVIVALLLVAAIAAAAQLASGDVIPPEMGYLIGGLIAAGIMATPWRWSMIIPFVLSVLGVVGALPDGFPQYALSHPAAERIAFPSIASQYGLLILSAGACLVLFVQALRGQAAASPRWTTPAIAGMVGVIVGALFIGAIAQPSGAGGAAAATAGTEAVHLTADRFAPDIVALHTGDTLTVIDDGPIPHILANGTWSASNQAQPGAEPGAPAINNVALNNNTVVLGPFSTPGAYHIYCTVHPGMRLTIIVQ
jgi:plastocyanin